MIRIRRVTRRLCATLPNISEALRLGFFGEIKEDAALDMGYPNITSLLLVYIATYRFAILPPLLNTNEFDEPPYRR